MVLTEDLGSSDSRRAFDCCTCRAGRDAVGGRALGAVDDRSSAVGQALAVGQASVDVAHRTVSFVVAAA